MGWTWPFADGTTDCRGEIQLARAFTRTLSLAVRTEQPCVLVFMELAYPGWHATVDGGEASLPRADGVLSAIALSAGSHRVEMDFGRAL